MRTILQAALLFGLSTVGAACATTQAKAPVERPALEVPPVPPRTVEASPVSAPPEPKPVADLPPAQPNPRPRQPERDSTRPDPKTEPPPAEPPPVQAPPAQPVVPPLRTAGSPDPAEATRQIREITARAAKLLETIDYRVLNTERRAQYDNAKMFIAQAEEALKAANFEFAKGVADKAERLARELQGR